MSAPSLGRASRPPQKKKRFGIEAMFKDGQRTKFQHQESYICRQEEQNRTQKRHSNFWIGLYGLNWIVAWHECQAWVEELVAFSRNKQAYYQRGLRAMKLIHQAL